MMTLVGKKLVFKERTSESEYTPHLHASLLGQRPSSSLIEQKLAVSVDLFATLDDFIKRSNRV